MMQGVGVMHVRALAGTEEAEPTLSPAREHVFQADPNAKPLFPAAYRGGGDPDLCLSGCVLTSPPLCQSSGM